MASRSWRTTAQMISAALDAGVAAWFMAGDEVYGNDCKLRAALVDRCVGYVLAVACDHRAPNPQEPVRADLLTDTLPTRSWQKMSAGVPGRKAHGSVPGH